MPSGRSPQPSPRRSRRRSRPAFESLEARVLYAADAVALVPGAGALAPAVPAPALAAPLAEGPAASVALAAPSGSTAHAGPAQTAAGRELVVIDARVQDVPALLADIDRQAAAGRDLHVLVVQADEDTIDTIGRALAELGTDGTRVQALHLLGHGEAGDMTLGRSTIDLATLRARADAFAGWAPSLAAGADLLLYGCDFAASASGRDAVDALAALTGADVAASVDLTGAAGLGGDWDLEYRHGQVDAPVALDDAGQAGYAYTLATFTVSNTADSGAGSLRQAILDANATPGKDTIVFAIGAQGSSATITLASALPTVTDAVVIDGRSQGGPGYQQGPLVTLNGANSVLDGLTITAGNSTVTGLAIERFTGNAVILQTGGGNVIQGNSMGVDPVTLAQMPNGDAGVLIWDSSNNLVGGTAFADGNVIGYNTGIGIQVIGASTGNALLGNATSGNGGLGIDLAADGVTANDALDGDAGPNGLQNTPVLTSADATAAGTTIAGTLNSTAFTTFRIEFQQSLMGTGDASGHGEARRTLGAITVTTDASGNASFNATVAGYVNAGDIVTATATVDLGGGAYGSTSEYAANVAATSSGVVVVNTASDATGGNTASIAALQASRGPDNRISLREALLAANNTANGGTPDLIAFDIFTFGAATISPGSALPQITDAVTIDARTQPGYAGVPLVELNGAGAGVGSAGLNVAAASTTIRGLDIRGFGGSGIDVYASTATIQSNRIGTNRLGTLADGNANGIVLHAGDGMLVGGTGAGEGNLISGNSGDGVWLMTGVGHTIQGNLIGTDATGSAAIANGNGVHVDGASGFDTIGGASVAARNVISGNTGYGITLTGPSGPAGVIGRWTLDNTLADSVGTNDGGAVGGPAYATGLSGRALDLNGSTQYVSIADAPSLQPAAFTLEAWANPDTFAAGWNNVIARGSTGSGPLPGSANSFQLGFLNGGHVTAHITTSVTSYSVTSAAPYASGAWHHLAATYDGAALNLYVDGVLAGSVAASGSIVYDSGAPLLIGADENAGVLGVSPFDGRIDQAAVYDRALSATEIANLFSANGAGMPGTTIQGNYVGVDASGGTALGNGAGGVIVETANNLIGGAASAGNVVSGNGWGGILLSGRGATANQVLGNITGLDASGTVAIANVADGIQLWDGASGNLVGAVGMGNLVSGNSHSGIYLGGNVATTANTIQGNLIGTDVSGTLARPNAAAGITLDAHVADNLFGGIGAGEGNTIRSNTGPGIATDAAASSGNAFLRNTIDGNGSPGIDLGGDGVTANDAGDADTGANDLQNTPVLGAAGTVNTTTTITGTLNSNASTAYRIDFYSAPTGDPSGHGSAATWLGFTTASTDGSGNASFTATLNGVVLTAGHKVTATATVDLGAGRWGSTSEFAANVTATATTAGITVTPITSTTTEAGGTAQFSIVLTSAPSANVTIGLSVGDPTEGSLAIGSVTFTPLNWNVAQVVTVTGVDDTIVDGTIGYSVITAAASSGDAGYNGLNAADVALTNTDNDTYNILYVTNASDTVNGNTSSVAALLASDGGDGVSLREAILATNATANGPGGPDRIYFAIAGGGVHTISATSALPVITDTVIIDGYSQTGASVNTASASDNATLLIALDGTGAGAATNGLDLAAGAAGSLIEGLAIGRFGGSGIWVESGAANVTVVGNFLGTDASGLLARPNNIGIVSDDAATRIGGLLALERNVISGNLRSGVGLNGTVGAVIQGNLIGVAADGATALGNGSFGVDGYITNGALIGGTAAGAGNVIAYNGEVGVLITVGSSTSNQILGNAIYGNAFGIDLGYDGVSANDAGDVDAGPNGLQNFPVLGVPLTTGAQITVGGTLDSTAATNFRVEVFASAAADATGHGQGQRFLGAFTVTTDGAGHASFGGTLSAAVAAGEFVSATATNLATGDTSEFSLNAVALAPTPPATFVPGAQSATEDTPLAIAGVSATDVNGDLSTVAVSVASGSLTVSLAGGATISAGANGSGSLTLSGSQAQINAALATLSYQGLPNFAGTDTLTVLSTDALGLTSSASVTIGVAAVDDAPTLAVPPAQSVAEDTTLVFGIAGGNAITVGDPDAGASPVRLTLSVAQGSLTLAGTAGLSFVTGTGTGDASMSFTGTLASINAALNGLAYRGALNFSGADTLSLLVDDLGNTGAGGPLSASQTIGLTVTAVNDAPTVTLPAPQSLAEDGALSLGVAGGNAIQLADVDAGGATVQLTMSVAHGTFSLSGTAGLSFVSGTGTHDTALTVTGTLASLNAALDGLVYWPGANFFGGDALAIQLDDLGNTGSGGARVTSTSLALTVTPVDDAPTLSTPAAQSVAEDMPLVFSVAAGNAIGLADLDAGGNPVQLTLSVGAGTVSLASTAGLSFVTGTGTHDATVTVTGTLASLSAALDGLVYRGAANVSGADTLSIVLDDLGNTGAGGPLAVAGSVSITVTPVNDAPVLTLPAPQTLAENGSRTFGTAGGNAIVLADVDAGAATVQLTLSVAHGTLSLAGTAGLGFVTGTGTGDTTMTVTGTLASLNAALDGLVYQPGANYNGADSLAVQLDDLGHSGAGGAQIASGAVALTVTAVNNPPTIAAPAPQTIAEDTTLVFGTAGGNAITIADVDAGANPVQVTLSVAQGRLTLAGTAGLAFLSGTGTGDTTMRFTGTLANVNAALDGLAYQGVLDFNGADSLLIGVDDLGNVGAGGAGTASASVALTVTAVNDAPTVTAPAAQSVAEDTDLVFSAAGGNAIVIGDADAGGAAVRVTLSVSSGTLTLASTAGLAFVTGTGSGDATMRFTGTLASVNAALDGLVYRGTLDFNGADALAVQVDDLGNAGAGGALVANHSVGLTVAAVNDAPRLALPAGGYATTEGVPIALQGTGLAISDVDAGSGPMRLTLSVGEGVLTVVAGGTGATVAGSGTASVTLDGTLAQIDALLAGALGAGIDFVDALHSPSATTSLQLQVTDLGNTGLGGAASASAATTIGVTAVDEPPTIALPATYQAIEQTTLALHGTGIAIADPDAATAPVSLTLSVGEGVLNVSAGSTGVVVAGNGTGRLTLVGTVASLNALLAGQQSATLLYFDASDTPAASTTLTLVVDDGGNTGTGGPKTASATSTVRIAAVDDAPSDLALASSTVPERSIPGVVVGSVGVTDPDDVAGFSFALTDTAGGHFAIDPASGTISVASPLPNRGQAPDYTISVRVTDPAGQSIVKSFTLTLTEVPIGQNGGTGGFGGSAGGPGSSGTSTSTSDKSSDDRMLVIGDDGGANSQRRFAFIVDAAPRRTGVAASAATAAGLTGDGWGHLRDDRLEGATVQIDYRSADGDTTSERLDARLLLESLHRRAPALASGPDFGNWGAPATAPSVAPVELPAAGEPGAARSYQIVMDTVETGSLVLSLGVVLWVVRGGGLLAAMLTSLPAWRAMDPMVLLAPPNERKGNWDPKGEATITGADEEAAVAAVLDA